MKKAKLYLICPDCQIEQVLRNKFGQNAYFLTALGAVFDFSSLSYTAALRGFIDRAAIAEIVIVNDTNCTFVKDAICGKSDYKSRTEQELRKLQENNSERFSRLDTNSQHELLAKLNIYRQAYELSDESFIHDKLKDGLLSISGLIYRRDNSSFEPLLLTL